MSYTNWLLQIWPYIHCSGYRWPAAAGLSSAAGLLGPLSLPGRNESTDGEESSELKGERLDESHTPFGTWKLNLNHMFLVSLFDCGFVNAQSNKSRNSTWSHCLLWLTTSLISWNKLDQNCFLEALWERVYVIFSRAGWRLAACVLCPRYTVAY